MEIKHILCPTDFSEFSRNALYYAMALARWYGSKVTVMHAVPRYIIHPDQFSYAAEPLSPPMNLREYAIHELNSYIAQARAGGVAIDNCLQEGETVEGILEVAERLQTDLIVMGTHGRKGFERFVLGSVTEKILRKAKCPVLTVTHAPELTEDGMVDLHAILVPVDFSPSSIKASEYASSVAQETQVPLLLLHVVEHFMEPYSAVQWSDALEFHRERLQSEAKEFLRKALPETFYRRLKPEELVETGRSYQRILELAEERKVGLIVMGVLGRSALSMAVFGSTTNHVVRAARCPVLTIRTG